jgi:hypothetical protein
MNHLGCAAKERDLLIDGAANPSFEGREWNPSRNQPHSPFNKGGGRSGLGGS